MTVLLLSLSAQMGQLQLVRLEVSGVITQKASDTWGLVSCFRDCESYLPPALGGNTIQV